MSEPSKSRPSDRSEFGAGLQLFLCAPSISANSASSKLSEEGTVSGRTSSQGFQKEDASFFSWMSHSVMIMDEGSAISLKAAPTAESPAALGDISILKGTASGS